MTGAYYDRRHQADGSFANAEDNRAQDEVGLIIESEWPLRLHPFGLFSPLDWWASQVVGPIHGPRAVKRVAVIEFKHRSHGIGTHPTVWLNLRKHAAMVQEMRARGTAAVFVVAWTDHVGWYQVREDLPRIFFPVAGGTVRRVKSETDMEQVIPLPVDLFRAMNDVPEFLRS